MPMLILILLVVLVLLIVKAVKKCKRAGLQKLQKKAQRLEESGDYEGAFLAMQELRKKKQTWPEDDYQMGLLCKKGFAANWQYTNEDGIAWFQKAASAGHVGAQFELGKIKFTSLTATPLDKAHAIASIRKASEKNYQPAIDYWKDQQVIAQALLSQNNGRPSLATAAIGHADSQYYMGQVNCRLPDDGPVTAIEWFLLAAEQGHRDAQRVCGDMYYYGRGIPADKKKGVQWLTKAAEQGCDLCQGQLGYIYKDGSEYPADIEKAFYWSKKSAEQNNPDAQYNLAMLYRQKAQQRAESANLKTRLDRITDREYRNCLDQSDKWLKQAAENGSKEAFKALHN